MSEELADIRRRLADLEAGQRELRGIRSAPWVPFIWPKTGSTSLRPLDGRGPGHAMSSSASVVLLAALPRCAPVKPSRP